MSVLLWVKDINAPLAQHPAVSLWLTGSWVFGFEASPLGGVAADK
jgi:hypothetical protein